MNKKQAQSMQTRKTILDAAGALFARKGYHATSLEEIAAVTETGKTNIYYHFKSKEGLFQHLLEERYGEWLNAWEEQSLGYPSISQRLYALVEGSIAANYPLVKAAGEFMHASCGQDNGFKSWLTAKIEEERARLANLINLGMASGEFKPGDALLLAAILDSLFRGLDYAAAEMNLEQTQQLYRTALGVFLHGIAADKSC